MNISLCRKLIYPQPGLPPGGKEIPNLSPLRENERGSSYKGIAYLA